MPATPVRQRFPLPLEPIVQIADIPEINDLAAFARTCRQTYQATIGELYRAACDVDQIKRDLDDDEDYEDYHSAIPLYLYRAARAGNSVALARMLDLFPAALLSIGSQPSVEIVGLPLTRRQDFVDPRTPLRSR